MRHLRTLAFVACFASSLPASAYQTIPPVGSPQTIHVFVLYPRNQGFAAVPGAANQGFFFSIDAIAEGISCAPAAALTVNTNTFVVPKQDPSNPAADNPAYRDYINSIMLAFMLEKPVVLYVDSCLGITDPATWTPRVVGIDVQP